MSLVWVIMLLASIGALMITDPSQAVTAMVAGANNAVQLAIQLVAQYGFWLGLFAMLDKLGVADWLAKVLAKPVNKLFPGSSEEARKYITMNMAANMLGLGNAATPMGMNATRLLSEGNERANANVCTFIIISSTSLQLLPTTVIGMRAAGGSTAPSDFLPACLVATVLSTMIGITISLIIRAVRQRKRGVT